MAVRHPITILLSSVACASAIACGVDVPDTASDRDLTGSRITLAGCVGAGESPGEYALREIRVDTGNPPAPPDLPQAPPVPGVTEGAWVRLEGHDAQLQRLFGQRVRLTGEVTDTGENTIGTGGVFGYETPSGDTSQAAGDGHYSTRQQLEAGRIARESMANGRAAEIRVTGITPTGEPCATPRIEEPR